MIKTGVEPWVKTGQMPTGRGFEKVKRYVRDVEVRLVEALGGLKTITPQQEILIQGTIKALGVCCLVELYINREGPIVKHLLRRGIVELQPCLGKSYLAFLNTIRQNVIALGLDRKETERILSPADLADIIDKENEEKARVGRSPTAQGMGQGSGQVDSRQEEGREEQGGGLN